VAAAAASAARISLVITSTPAHTTAKVRAIFMEKLHKKNGDPATSYG
jgi:hypothetical protein